MTRPAEGSLFREPPPLPPPQAVSTIAPAMPVAMSAAWRLLRITCDASLVPRTRGGNGQVFRHGRRTFMRVAPRSLAPPRCDGVDPRHASQNPSTTVTEL